jgi:hypothetical protein
MGVVRYRCANTDEEVTTAIETGNDVLFKMRSMDLKIWVWCPHCMAGHSISPSEAILEDDGIVSDAELSPSEPWVVGAKIDRDVN